MQGNEFSPFAWAIATQKNYVHMTEKTWDQVGERVAGEVFKTVGDSTHVHVLKTHVSEMISKRQFMPGGRYLYATGRPFHQTQNCLLLRAQDSREGWSDLLHKASMALMTGAGIGVDYSNVREEGAIIRRTGGLATGPIALMQMLNECGRGIMQGGSRRCLLKGAPVILSDGSRKPIEQVQVGDEVVTRFGPRKVVAIAKQGLQEILHVKTKYGEVYCSKNHRWLGSKNDRKICWLTASKLKPGWSLYYQGVPDPIGKQIDNSWAYTLGYFLGNGCAYSCNRTHEVTFSIPTKHVSQEQLDTIEKGMRRYSVKMKVCNGHGNCLNVRFRSKQLVSVFQEFKQPHKSFTVPPSIQEADKDGRSAFLAGWCDADGSLHEERKVRVSCKHEEALRSLGLLAKSLGLLTCIKGTEIAFKASQNQLWNETIGKFSHKYENLPVKNDGSVKVKDVIISVTEVGLFETFDLQIDGVEEFVAYDHISHNSAIWAGLNWRHADAQKFIGVKNWSEDVRRLKEKNFSFPATLDQTNISILLDDRFFEAYHNLDDNDHALANQVYWAVVRQMLSTAEPGFSIDVGQNKGETLRNACTEVTSRDSNDICNLGSINMGRFETLPEFESAVWSATAFLLAGTLYSDVPYPEVDMIRTKNRRLGLGLMGIHEWLLRRGKKYGPDDELAHWLESYEQVSRKAADVLSEKWKISRPEKVRAIAPTGTISIVAETSSGIEPIFCVAYKRRYLRDGKNWVYQYVIDPVAKRLIEEGADPNKIEDAYSLASNIERRVEFQSWLQKFVDHGISSTINLPHWGSEYNNEDTVQDFGNMLMKYLPNLRGVTVYPDGARGGQPLTPVPYAEAVGQEGIEIIESAADICSLTGKGTCGD